MKRLHYSLFSAFILRISTDGKWHNQLMCLCCDLLTCEMSLADMRLSDMPTPTAAHKNLIMASLVHLSFPSACHGLFLIVFVLLIVAANEYPDSSCSGM